MRSRITRFRCIRAYRRAVPGSRGTRERPNGNDRRCVGRALTRRYRAEQGRQQTQSDTHSRDSRSWRSRLCTPWWSGESAIQCRLAPA